MKRNNFFSYLLFLLTVITFSSCATLFSKKQTVFVNSDVEGAMVYKGKKYVGKTPLMFKTKAAKSTFTATKPGYPTQKIHADVAVRGNTLWNFLNCFLLWPIDLMTGSSQKYVTTAYNIYLKDPEKNKVYDIYNRELIAQQYREQNPQSQINWGEVAVAVLGGVAEGLSQSQQIEAEKKRQEAEREAQFYAEQQARVAQNKQKYAEFQAMTNKKSYSSNYQTNSSSSAQGSYNDLLTSDPNWNAKVHMMVQQYGVAKTREMVKQQRASSYQESVQSSSSNSYNQSVSERIVSAVTSSRQQLKIKVRGNSVVAYSNGLDQVGRQKWVTLTPVVGISRTGAGSIYNSSSLSREFSHTAYINGT